LAVGFGEGEADAIAVGERRRGVELNLREREAGCVEGCAELLGFLAELRGVREVLKLATAARAEVWAGWNGVGFVEVDLGGHPASSWGM
jgi:hypothetical protein